MPSLDGTATVFCEGAFNTPNGKTAHGLVRHTRRYRVVSVIDSKYAGGDPLGILDGRESDIALVSMVDEAVERATAAGAPLTHFVVGLAPDGGRLPPEGRAAVREAIESGLNVDSGLHDFLSDDEEITALARSKGVTIRDIRKPPDRKHLHFFSGKIAEVTALKIAVLGTDSAVGKRTTAWLIVDAFNRAGVKAELVGTGQTAWMQGARHCLVMDSLINDFVSGEIEHATWAAWKVSGAEVVVIEGQGSLLNPAYPGGFEILAAGRPDVVVLQHAPTRTAYDGFPDCPMHAIARQIEAVELIGGKPVVAITLNHEGLEGDQISHACEQLQSETGLPTFDVLRDGADGLFEVLAKHRSH
jgi:uncharacterized NAD-dependent epimerase/dehydratase family protein